MTDVVIERCVLRIRRFGGWSWGPHPDALLAAATRALPRLLTARLRDLPVATGSADVRISEPLRVRIAVRLDELAATASDPDQTVPGELGARIAAAIEAAVASAGAEIPSTAEMVAEAPASPAFDGISAPVDDSILSALVRWQREGTLEAILDMLPTAEATAWRRTVERRWAPTQTPQPDRSTAAAEVAFAARASHPALMVISMTTSSTTLRYLTTMSRYCRCSAWDC